MEKAIHTGWMLVFLLMPFSIWWDSTAIVCTGILSVFKVLVGGYEGEKLNWRNPQLLPVPVFIIYAFSLLYTSDLSWGGELLFRQNTYLIFPIIIIINSRLFIEKFDVYIKVFIVGLSLSGLITIGLNYVPQHILEEFTRSTSMLTNYKVRNKRMSFGGYSPFLDRLRYSYLLGTGTLVLIWQLCKKGINLPRIIAVGVMMSTMLLLGARGAQLAILASLMIWLLYSIITYSIPKLQKRLGKRIAYMLGVAYFGVIVIGAPIVLNKTVPSVNARYSQLMWELKKYQSGKMQPSKNYDYLGFTGVRRIQSWKNTWKIIKRQPLLGAGIGDWEEVLDKQYENDELGFPPNSQQQFLHHWLIAGMLGLLSLIVMLIGFLLAMRRSGGTINQLLGFTFILFFVITFLFDIPLWYQTSRVGFLATFGMILLLTINPQNNFNQEKTNKSHNL